MINRQWVTTHIFSKPIKSHLVPLPTVASGWRHIMFWWAISSHLVPWPTGRKGHCTCFWKQSHHIVACPGTGCEWHSVTFCKANPITPCPTSIINSSSWWVTLQIFLRGNLITSHPGTNRKWVTFELLRGHESNYIFNALGPMASRWHCIFFWNWGFSLHLILGPRVGKQHCTYSEKQSHHCCPMTNRMWVTQSSHITFFWKPMSSHVVIWPNRWWVTLHILWMAISSWTVGEWHCTFFWRPIISRLVLWPTVCEQDIAHFSESQAHDISSYDQRG